MKELVLPVPKMVSATYVVPVSTPMGTAEATQKASMAVETRLTGPLRTLTAEWLAKGVVKVGVEAAGPPPSGLLDRDLFGTPEQRVFLARARAFVRFSATQRASLIGMQEWKARGPAAALAAEFGAPVLDLQALQVLAAEDALAALPDTTLTIPASISGDITIGLTFKSWVRVHDVGYQGMIAVMTDGMRRFGLPELRLGPASPELREELTTLLNGVAFRIWADLIARAQDTPKATGLLHLPRLLRVPAEMDIHRRDLDRANGVPNRGGTFALIGLQFDPVQGEHSGGWLTVCPPACWDTSWEDFIADTCHGMFGFEKPRWHYIPEFGALVDALAKAAQTLPEARSRFLSGDLPPGGRLMVRYDAADTGELRWARVESWEDAGHAVIRDAGRELAPGVRPAPLWRSRPGSSLTGASGWTAAASSRAPAPKAPATISRSPYTRGRLAVVVSHTRADTRSRFLAACCGLAGEAKGIGLYSRSSPTEIFKPLFRFLLGGAGRLEPTTGGL